MVARESIGTNENEPRLSLTAHEVRSKKIASLGTIVVRESSFPAGLYRVFDANYASEKTGARILWA